MPKQLIVGNWKMNNTIPEALYLIAGLQHRVKNFSAADVAVAPPFTALYSVAISLQDTPIKLGAQNIFWEDKGAYTGEISGGFLKDIGCEFVIVGHSERRRHLGETDEMVNKKLLAALRNDLVPIMCIGETLPERERGETFRILDRQIKGGLAGLVLKDVEKIVVAYEPVWAIGTGKVATPEEAQEAQHFIRNHIAKMYDAPTANAARILYGGSAKASNAGALLEQPDVDGVLVGGACLDAAGFADIVAQAKTR